METLEIIWTTAFFWLGTCCAVYLVYRLTVPWVDEHEWSPQTYAMLSFASLLMAFLIAGVNQAFQPWWLALNQWLQPFSHSEVAVAMSAIVLMVLAGLASFATYLGSCIFVGTVLGRWRTARRAGHGRGLLGHPRKSY